jgi:hypothetical protein
MRDCKRVSRANAQRIDPHPLAREGARDIIRNAQVRDLKIHAAQTGQTEKEIITRLIAEYLADKG